METLLIVYDKTTRKSTTYELGRLDGKAAQDKAAWFHVNLKLSHLAHTPKILGNRRFYLGVVRG